MINIGQLIVLEVFSYLYFVKMYFFFSSGNAMDELMRHQPSLRTDATAGIIKLLEELCALGKDPNYIASSRTQKFEATQSTSARTGPVEATGGGSSDEEEEEEEEATSSSNPAPARGIEAETGAVMPSEKTPVPLVDYVLNVMKFVDAILSNNSTDDHCREFVVQKGLVPLMDILGLPNLPVDFPVTPACQVFSFHFHNCHYHLLHHKVISLRKWLN